MFFKRIGAYILDCIILFFAIMIVNLFIPVNSNANALSDKMVNLMQDYINEKITVEEFNKESLTLNYQLTKETYISSIASIVIYILYFVVFQAYNNGQTLGKKLFKIQVVKDDDSIVDMNTLLVRSLIPYGILVNFILVVLILFASEGLYNNISNVISNIHMVVIFVTIIMMMVKSKGLHDYLSKTKVEQI